MACCIMGGITTSGKSSVMILLVPIVPPMLMTMSAISDVVYAEIRVVLGVVRCSCMDCFF